MSLVYNQYARDIQQLLNRLYDTGLVEDGLLGPLTAKQFIRHLREPDKRPDRGTTGVVEVDSRSQKNIDTLDPKARGTMTQLILHAKAVAADFGADAKIISGHRGEAEQNALYEKGRTKPGPKVTNARFGYSNHNFGIAVDIGIFKEGEYLDSTSPALAKRIHTRIADRVHDEVPGLDWGGDWRKPDIPHWEIDVDMDIGQKQAEYRRYGSVL